MLPYLAILRAGFRRQFAYRLATASGLAANLFFGLVRTALFTALYRERDTIAGLDLGGALTYVWMLEAMFAVVFTPWMWEFPEAVRSGAFATELTRPGDAYLRVLAYDLGRNLSQLLVRGTLPILLAALVLPLRLPTDPAGVTALAASMLLAAVVAFNVRLLYGLVAFWTPDYRAALNLSLPVLWLLGGFFVPVDYLPGPLRAAAELSPLTSMLMAPTRVAMGEGLGPLATQALWVLVLGVVARAGLATATRRMVVHGG